MTGWICSRCGRSNAPFIVQCPCTPPPKFAPRYECGCPENGTCMNIACPRRTIITCNT